MGKIVLYAAGLLLSYGLVSVYSADDVSMDSYFPEVNGDFSKITWAHAVNSQSELNSALEDDVMMLECDISLGRVVGRPAAQQQQPIMAHPPAKQSDISFEDWLNAVINAKKKKGIKLDFKSIEVVEPSLAILQDRIFEIEFPVWINADILPGPAEATAKPVDGPRFLRLCKQYFPASMVSPGWTTLVTVLTPEAQRLYEWNDVLRMAMTLREANVIQPVTFPVRAAFLSNSIQQLLWLSEVIPGSSMTVWSGKVDVVDASGLLDFDANFANDKLFYDLPFPLHEVFYERLKKERQPKDAVSTPNFGCDAAGPLVKLSTEGDGNCLLAGSKTVVLNGDCEAVYVYPAGLPPSERRALLSGSVQFLGATTGIRDEDSFVEIVNGADGSGNRIVIRHYGNVEFYEDGVRTKVSKKMEDGNRFQIETTGKGAPSTVVTLWGLTDGSNPSEYVLNGGSEDFAFKIVGKGNYPKVLENIVYGCSGSTSVATKPSGRGWQTTVLSCIAFLLALFG